MILNFIRIKIPMRILKSLSFRIFMRKLFVYLGIFLVLLSVKLRTCFINLYDLCKLILLPNNNFNNHTYSKKGVNSYEEI